VPIILTMTVTAVEALQIWMQSKQTFQDFGLALAPSLSTLDFLLINMAKAKTHLFVQF